MRFLGTPIASLQRSRGAETREMLCSYIYYSTDLIRLPLDL